MRFGSALVDRLRRITTPGTRYVGEIDGLRFIAISLVVVYHLSQSVVQHSGATTEPRLLLSYLNRVGYYAVPLFFTISGLVLSLPFARERFAGARPVKLRAYYYRRVTRLEPPYLIALFGWFIFDWITSGRLQNLRHTLASAIYSHDLIYGKWSPSFGISWSLEVEIQFYLLAPLLARLVFRLPLWHRRLGLLAFMAVWSHVSGGPTLVRWHLSLAGHIQEFLGGFLLADIYVASWREAPPAAWRWDAAAVTCWFALMFGVGHRQNMNDALPVLIFASYYFSLRGRLMRRLLSLPWITTIGGMCYTIYLIHEPIAEKLGALLGPMRLPYETCFVRIVTLALPTIVIVSFAFFIFIERPCMNPQWPAQLMVRLRRSHLSHDREPS